MNQVIASRPLLWGKLKPEMLTTLAIANYRSLLQLVVPLGTLNVITGPNGSGKSNLYRSLRLLTQSKACFEVITRFVQSIALDEIAPGK